MKPTFAKDQIAALDENTKLSRAYGGVTYYPGIVGLNNIKANDYCNVVLHVSFGFHIINTVFLRLFLSNICRINSVYFLYIIINKHW